MFGFKINSIARRLTLLLGLIAFFVLSAIGAAHYWALKKELIDHEREEVLGKVALVNKIASLSLTPEKLFDRLDDIQSGHGGLMVWLLDDSGRLLYGDSSLPEFNPDAPDRDVRWRGEKTLHLFPPLKLHSSSFAGTQLIIGLDTTARTRLLEVHFWKIILISSVGFFAMIALATYALKTGLAPVRNLAHRAGTISPDTLSDRLATDGIDVELVEFAESFNRALDSMETAYRQLEAFNADVAHELRTPLATLINGTQIALSKERSPEELREVLTSALEELEHLRIIVSDMQFLSRADRGERASEVTAISLAAEAHRVAEFFEAMLEEKTLILEVTGDNVVDANPSLVRRAIANLVDNAIRYAPPGSTIDVLIDHERDTARLRVRNLGQTIAANNVPHVFDRFFRADSARSGQGVNQGLGLAIVKAIAQMHGGRPFACSAAGVTDVGFTLPVRRIDT
jgi:two-component system heavy metal sensor histidine kinase CusS